MQKLKCYFRALKDKGFGDSRLREVQARLAISRSHQRDSLSLKIVADRRSVGEHQRMKVESSHKLLE